MEDVARVRMAARLRGELRLPGDKSISHRALMLAALATGESRIEGSGDGADVRSTAGILRGLGVNVERSSDDDRTAERGALLRVGGRDLERGLRDPDRLGGDPDAAGVERAQRDRHALARLAEPLRRRALEDDVGSR